MKTTKALAGLLVLASALGPLESVAATALPALDVSVTRVLGAPNQRQVMLNRIVSNSGAQLGGVHVDTSHTPNRFYVLDSANNRILGFYGFRPPNPDGSFPSADIVIGQPSLWDQGAANGDNSQLTPPTDRSLAFLPFPYVASTAEGGRSGMMATDAQGNLYVADLCNNRVLKFNDPFTTDTIADDVWGQSSFTNRSHPSTPTASSLNIQWVYGELSGTFSAGVDVDAGGNLWVADSGNHRVLRFPRSSKTADLVLGQTDFTSANAGGGLNEMNKPTAVRLQPVTGELYVLDGEQSTTCRLLVFTPPFTNGQSAARVIGQASSGDQASGLHFARGFAFDPRETNSVWVADCENRRILRFNNQTGAMLEVIGFSSFSQLGDAYYERYDGITATLPQVYGEISFDADANLYCTPAYIGCAVARAPTPLQRNAQGVVKSDSQMMSPGWNQITGRTMQDHYGMALAGGRLFGADGQRLLVWSNAATAAAFQAADFVIGQSTLDTIESGGTFNGAGIGQMAAGGGWLFVISDTRIFVFQLPITHGGKDYPPFRVLSGDDDSVKWADDNAGVRFRPNGLAYDSAQNALWVADYPNNRILRIADPIGATQRVDLVIGQTSKTASAQNHGLGLFTPDARGLAAPWSLALDRFGNLYAVDSGFEGRVDNAGNLRVLRFDAASLVPTPGNIFTDPAATGVFCKTNFTDNRDWFESNRPATPTFVAFDSQNHMVLLVDSYGNPQGQRVFWYRTPHLGQAPEPSQVVATSFGQAAVAAFDERDNLIIQDHTWNHFLFYAWSSNAPLPGITNQAVVVPSSVSAYTVQGTNSSSVAGTMWWITSNGESGTLPAAAAWSVEVPLSTEATVITVCGTNQAGALGSDAITIAHEVLSPPAIVPLGGTFTNSVQVMLATYLTNCDLRFTLDGSEPTEATARFLAPFDIGSNVTVKARSYRVGWPPSATATANFQIQVAAPTISPPGASITNSVEVALDCATPGAIIRYTLDGSEPTVGSLRYTAPVVIESTTQLEAKAFRDGANPSTTTLAWFTNTLPAVATPSLTPAGGVFSGSVTVAVHCVTAGAEIRYTTDGREPSRTSGSYAAPFQLAQGAVIKAKAYASGLAPSPTASAVFTLLAGWQGIVLPDTGERDRHVALGSDGANLYFTMGNAAAAPFYRLAKGATSNWTTLSPLPIPATVDGSSGVGDLAFGDGALWTLAVHSSTGGERAVYRYDIQSNVWTKGAPMADGGANAAIAPVRTNLIFGGWIGWSAVRKISDWQGGVSSEAGYLEGDTSHAWDSCLGPDSVWFLKHHSTASNAGVLARLEDTGSSAITPIAGLPFNPGMGCAIEFMPGELFADQHARLYVLRGGDGTSDGDGADWVGESSTRQLAIYDLVTQSWSVETLPFSVDQGSEMCRVGDTLYILAANSDPSPLKITRLLLPTLAPEAPHLSMILDGGIIRLSWEEAARGFTLETAPALASPAAWTNLVSGTNRYDLPLNPGAGVRFFRLRWP